MTLQELKYRVLLKLHVCAAGDSPEADDGATVMLRYNALYNLLSADDLTSWNISDDIPDEYETPIVLMVAAECARDFANADPGMQMEGKYGLPQASIAERQLRKVAATKYISSPQRVEYF
jgi:hypothetical protein